MTNVETVSTNGQMGFEDLLSRIEQFDKPVLLQFADIINGLVYKKNQTSTYEAQLVRKIKSNIPVSIKRRQKELYVKMQNNALSIPEKDELILLNSMIEEKTAEKIRFMGELAQLRHISIEELNHQLNPQTNYA
jgi:hypothetical protein